MATAAAQSPPIPPARFAGTVSINGAPAPGGTPIEARVGSASCGTASVFIEGGASRYVIDVAAESTATPGCGTDGATVSFFVAGQAAGSGSWVNFDLNQLNLGSSTATPTPTATGTPTGTATAPPATPLFWGHGLGDPAIPFALAEKGRNRLRRAGAELDARDYRIGHWIADDEVRDAVAMVEAPNGTGYSLRRGACIGKNGGVISAVRTGEVVVSEWAIRADGTRDKTQTVIQLPKEASLQLEE